MSPGMSALQVRVDILGRMARKKAEPERGGTVWNLAAVLLLAPLAAAGTIWVADCEYQADLCVYATDYEYQADLCVYVTDYEYQAADSDGEWFFADCEYQADASIFYVDYEYQADLRVFFVDWEYQAGWNCGHKWQERLH
jgi:hypothetical protein